MTVGQPASVPSVIALPASAAHEASKARDLTGAAVRWALRLLALTVCGLAVLYGLFYDRGYSLDEAGLWNPVYQLVQTGRMTYPAHSAPDAMYIHPPTHYLVVAAFHALGLNMLQSSGLPHVLMTLLGVGIVHSGRFSAAVKAALLYALGIAWLWFPIYTVRPDLHMALAWLAGLAALESGRTAGWDVRRLLLGAALLTYASALHYPASLAWLGVGVYAVWALRTLGWREARPPLVSMLVGGLIVGVPYAALFVLPLLEKIILISTGVQGPGGIPEAIARHRADYQYIAGGAWPCMVACVGWAAPLWPFFALGLPLVLVGPPLLALHPTARGMALAGLPHLLFLLLYPRVKWGFYYTPEVMLGVAGIGAGLLALLGRWRMLQVAAVILLCGVLIWTDPTRAIGTRRFAWRVDEHELARATARSTLGAGATVGATSVGLWYITGADDYYFVNREVTESADLGQLDVAAYLDRFDALALDGHYPDATMNRQRKNLAAWYADATLSLRGFWFGDRRPGFPGYDWYLLLTRHDADVVGHAYQRGQLWRFARAEGGDWHFLAQVCPATAAATLWDASYESSARFPLPRGDGQEQQVVRMLLAPAASVPDTPAACSVRDSVPLRRTELDPGELLRRPDRAIRFFYTPAQLDAR